MERVSRCDPDKVWKEMSTVLTDNAGIKLFNQKHLARSEVTDVISFRYNPIPGDNGMYSSEIIVNVQRAAEKGNRLRRRSNEIPADTGRCSRPNWDGSRELALYIAHGCNHLTGETDYDRAGQLRMRRRELRWLKQAGTCGLLHDLID